ncbi:MAG: hypothetical protein ACUVS3_12250 [Thermodesulfobacteriota bacterium]
MKGLHAQMFRRVRIRKVRAVQGDGFPEGTEREGWEKEAPQVGRRYCIYQDNGKVYRTSVVRRVTHRGFLTSHSAYVLEVLDQG